VAVLLRRRAGAGPTSWSALLDAVRLGPTDDATAVTALQLRDVIARLTTAGHWHEGDPNVLIVMDSGYDVTRLAFVLADLPVEVLGRIRSDRVLRLPKPPRLPRRYRSSVQARAGVRPGHPVHLAQAGAHHDHRDHPLRHRDRL
jgi:hypothetical protein